MAGGGGFIGWCWGVLGGVGGVLGGFGLGGEVHT